MANRWILGGLLALMAGTAAAERVNFNDGWRFTRHGVLADGSERPEPEDPAGLAAPGLDDSGWRRLDLPHDWGIEGPFRRELEGATGKLPWVGIGWYRKAFEVPQGKQERAWFLDLDGAMSNATIYLNGARVGEHPYGYSSFRIPLGDGIRAGRNVVAVRLDNKPESSRWYPGAGLYRDAWLVDKPAGARIAHNGVFVRTPKVTPGQAIIRVDVEIDGDPAGLKIRQEVLDASGEVLLRNEDGSPEGVFVLRNPELWTLASPALYRLRVSLVRDGSVVDRESVDFGIRSIRFDAREGFFLNGEPLAIRGVCQHHDLGPLGAAFHEEAEARRIRLLKEMGCNAIRTAHNPPSPRLVKLCDRMGVLLQVESFDVWDRGKRRNDYSRLYPEWHERDIRLMVRNFRNSPSVVMWSIGNEIPGGYQSSPNGWKTADYLRKIVKSEDPTRPVTMGNNSRESVKHLWQGIDLLGLNYKPDLYQPYLDRGTGVPVYGSETASTVSSRGEYFFPVPLDKSKGLGDFQVSSYDYYAPRWASRPDVEFDAQDATRPANLGEFVWTGTDYIGEPTPYNDDLTNLLNIHDPEERERYERELEEVGKVRPPSRSSYFGILDLCGFRKDRFYLYQSRWRPELPMVHILPHWNWPGREGEVTPVHVYTSGDEVELFLNGESLGRKRKDGHRLVWDGVKYAPGTLRAVAYRGGAEWAEAEKVTTGEPAALRVVEEPDAGGMAFLRIEVVDAEGRVVPRVDPVLDFKVDGDVEILAAGNGDPTCLKTMHRATRMPAFNGLCQVILRRGGKGSFEVSAEGLEAARHDF